MYFTSSIIHYNSQKYHTASDNINTATLAIPTTIFNVGNAATPSKSFFSSFFSSSSTATTMGSVETLSSFLVSSFVSATAATAATSFFSSCLGWKEAMTFVVVIIENKFKRG